MNIKKPLFVLFILFITITNVVIGQYKIVDSFSLSGNGKYDYLTYSQNHKLYVSHGDQVNIVNTISGKEIGVINGLSGVHGIALDNKEEKGYISNGKSNTISVFDIKTNKVIDNIPSRKNPDAIFYEKFSHTIIVGNGKDNSLSVIDPIKDKIIENISLGGKPEAIVSNGVGNIFVNIEDKSQIIEINLHSYKIVNTFNLLPVGEEPAGLAIDTKNNLLYSGCRNKTLVIIDYKKWKVVGAYPIGDHCDGVVYNGKNNSIFCSNGGDGTLTILSRIKNSNTFNSKTLNTAIGAKTITINKNEGVIYLPVSEFETVKDSDGKLIPKLNSFKILVIH